MAIINVKGEKVDQEQFNQKTAEEVLKWAAAKFGDKVELASSFSAEDVVLIDMLGKMGLKMGIFTLDTGRIHEETYHVADAIRKKYKIDIKSFFLTKKRLKSWKKIKDFIRSGKV